MRDLLSDRQELPDTEAKGQKRRAKRRLSGRTLLAALALPLCCGMLGGGLVLAHERLLDAFAGQRSTENLSVERAVVTLLDGRAGIETLSSANAVLRVAIGEALPMLELVRTRGPALTGAAERALSNLRSLDLSSAATLGYTGRDSLHFREALAALGANTGSLELRREAVRTIHEVLADAFRALHALEKEGGESGRLAALNLAWFQSFLERKH